MEVLTKPARLEHLKEILDFVSARAREQGLGEKRILEMELALEESLVNIARYAYPDDAGMVEVRCFPAGRGKYSAIRKCELPDSIRLKNSVK